MNSNNTPELNPAWLLHRRPYKENSVIAEFLVEHLGRTAMVINGARKVRSTKAPLLQPFSQVMISWRGRGELKTLTSIEPLNSCRLLGHRLFCGLYINELILRAVIPGQPIEGLTELYHVILQQLSTHSLIEPVLRYFELQLLLLTGYLPSFDYDILTGERLKADRFYCYQPGSGFTLAKERTDSYDRRYLYHVRILQSLAIRDFHNCSHYFDFKRFTRQALATVLGDRPLKSRELFIHTHKIKPSI